MVLDPETQTLEHGTRLWIDSPSAGLFLIKLKSKQLDKALGSTVSSGQNARLFRRDGQLIDKTERAKLGLQKACVVMKGTSATGGQWAILSEPDVTCEGLNPASTRQRHTREPIEGLNNVCAQRAEPT